MLLTPESKSPSIALPGANHPAGFLRPQFSGRFLRFWRDIIGFCRWQQMRKANR